MADFTMDLDDLHPGRDQDNQYQQTLDSGYKAWESHHPQSPEKPLNSGKNISPQAIRAADAILRVMPPQK